MHWLVCETHLVTLTEYGLMVCSCAPSNGSPCLYKLLDRQLLSDCWSNADGHPWLNVAKPKWAAFALVIFYLFFFLVLLTTSSPLQHKPVFALVCRHTYPLRSGGTAVWSNLHFSILTKDTLTWRLRGLRMVSLTFQLVDDHCSSWATAALRRVRQLVWSPHFYCICLPSL